MIIFLNNFFKYDFNLYTLNLNYNIKNRLNCLIKDMIKCIE